MRTKRLIAALSSFLLLPALASAAPLARSFTYQGELSQSGVPVNGTVNLRFSLWDAPGTGSPPTGGTQIGISQVVTDVPIDDGLFTTLVNAGGEFGVNAFNGGARWLQIEICTDASCASTTVLGPRQALTGAPYALGPWQLNGTDMSYSNGNVGIGTATPATPLQVRTTLEGIRVQGTSGLGYMGFSDDADNLLGYVGDAGVSDTDMYLGSQSNSVNVYAAGFVMTVKPNGRVGIGTYTPADKLEVRGNIREGALGEYFVPGSAENLRVIRGKVSSTGVQLLGSGFTCTRTGTGTYQINFSPSFPASPDVTVSAESSSSFFVAIVSSALTGTCTVRIVNASNTAVDATFHFIAAGLR